MHGFSVIMSKLLNFQTNPALSGNHLMDGTSGYCKFTNRSTPCLVTTPPRIFRLLMKGKLMLIYCELLRKR